MMAHTEAAMPAGWGTPKRGVHELYLEQLHHCKTHGACGAVVHDLVQRVASVITGNMEAVLSPYVHQLHDTAVGVLEQASLQHDDRIFLQATLSSSCAMYYKNMGDLGEALRHCTQALQLYRSMSNPPVQDLAAAGLNMAAVLGKAGRHSAAAQHAKGVVGMLTADDETGQPMTLSRARVLAIAHYNLGVELQFCKELKGSREAVAAAHQLASQYLPSDDPLHRVITDMYYRPHRRYKGRESVDYDARGRGSPTSHASSSHEGQRTQAQADGGGFLPSLGHPLQPRPPDGKAHKGAATAFRLGRTGLRDKKQKKMHRSQAGNG
eukprot:Sspe_Gene.69790::Locus_41163_Transcript_1_1_Confidence_1.000_Length_1027::g.69790::m.69790